MMKDINSLKNTLGYSFNNRQLAKEAVTHRSYAVERGLDYDNQRLEFLGDAVIEILLSEYLFNRYPKDQEGVLTKMRSALVKQGALAQLAREHGLGEYLIMGRGEQESRGEERDSTLCDLFEALVGAYYLDAGLDAVRKFLIPLIEQFFPDPKQLLETNNPKGTLQEYSQKEFGRAPSYSLLEATGPDHMPSYTIAVSINGKQLATGTAQKRKLAEKLAAEQALKVLASKQ